MKNGTDKRRKPIVVFMGHSESEELSKDQSSKLPKFTYSSFFGLHPEILSSNRPENDDVMFLCDSVSDRVTPSEFPAIGYYGMAAHKTVPEYHDTVTRLDREEDEISNALQTYYIILRKLIPRKTGLHCRREMLRSEPLLFWMNLNLT